MKYSLITCIVNKGYSQEVILASRSAGGTGATVISGRGSGSREATILMGIRVTPEKEVVLILADEVSKDNIMAAVCDSVGLSTPGQGIIYSQEVEEVIGLH